MSISELCPTRAGRALAKRSSFAIGSAFLFLAAAWPVFGDPYHECILTNMRGTEDRLAAGEIQKACLEITTPKKCRGYLPHNVTRESIFDFRLEDCLKECREANLWVRTVGECKT